MPNKKIETFIATAKLTKSSGCQKQSGREEVERKISHWANFSTVSVTSGEWKFHIVPKAECDCNLCIALGKVKDAFPGFPQVSMALS